MDPTSWFTILFASLQIQTRASFSIQMKKNHGKSRYQWSASSSQEDDSLKNQNVPPKVGQSKSAFVRKDEQHASHKDATSRFCCKSINHQRTSYE